MNFRLALAERQVKPHQTTALHLVAAFMMAGLGGVTFFLAARSHPDMAQQAKPGGITLSLAGLFLLGIIFSRNKWLLRPQINRAFRLVELLIMILCSVYLLLVQWWVPAGITGVLVAALIFSLYWERESNQIPYISVGAEGIRLPYNLRRKHLDWPEVERVLLRFGVLSVDCVDNHLFQWNIRQVDFDKAYFEDWCLQQIEAGKSKREKNDW